MTNIEQIREQRRASFEAAYKAQVEANCPGAFTPEVFARKASDGEYLIGPVQCAWWGFNVALDSVVIELPEPMEFDFPSGAAPSIFACRESIEAAGQKVKP